MKTQLGLLSTFVMAAAGPVVTTLMLSNRLETGAFAAYAAFVASVTFFSVLWLWGADGLVVRDLLKGSLQDSDSRAASYQRFMFITLTCLLAALLFVTIARLEGPVRLGLCVAVSSAAMASINVRIALIRARARVSAAFIHGAFLALVVPAALVASSALLPETAPILLHSLIFSSAALVTYLFDGSRYPPGLKLRSLKSGLATVAGNGVRTVPHTLSLIGLLTFDRIVASAVATPELVAQITLAGIVGALGHAAIAAVTSARLAHSYVHPHPELRMAQTALLCLGGIILAGSLVAGFGASLGWSSQTIAVASLYVFSPLAAVPYASLSSLIFVEHRELVLTFVSPLVFVLTVFGYVLSAVSGDARLIPIVQAAGYGLLSLTTLILMWRLGRNRRALTRISVATMLVLLYLVVFGIIT